MKKEKKPTRILPSQIELQGNHYHKRPSHECKAQMWILNQEDLLSADGLVYLFQVLISATLLFG